MSFVRRYKKQQDESRIRDQTTVQSNSRLVPNPTELLSINQWGVAVTATEGIVQVSNLDDIQNVTITTPEDSQVLAYDHSLSQWVNKALDEIIIPNEYGDIDVLAYLNSLSESAWENITNFSNAITSVGDALYQAVGDYVTQAFLTAQNFATQAWVGLQGFISDIGESLNSLTSEAWEAVTNFGEGVKNAVNSAYTWISEGIDTVADNVWESLKSSYDWLADGISAVADNVWTSLKDTYTWLADGIGDVSTAIGNALLAAGGLVTNAINSAILTISDLGEQAYNAVKAGLESVGVSSVDAITALSDFAASAYEFIFGTGGIDGTGSNNPDGGDIDMKTWDITNVDRIFFNSNDNPVISNAVHPSFAGYLDNIWFNVPVNKNYQFYIDSILTMQIASESNSIRYINFINNELRNIGYRTIENLTELELADLVVADDYLMVLDGSADRIKKIKASSLGGGGDVGIVDDITRNKVRLGIIAKFPIFRTSITLSNISATICDNQFGGWDGAAGIVTDLDSSERPYLYIKRNTRWTSLRFNDSQITSNTGRRFTETDHVIDKVHISITGNRAGTSSQAQLDGSTNVSSFPKGTMYVYTRVDVSSDPVYLGIKDSGIGLTSWEEELLTDEGVSSPIPLPTDDQYVSITALPFINDATPSASQLDGTDREDDGNMLFNEDENALWMKVNGVWHEKEF